MALRRGSWAIVTSEFTTYVSGKLVLDWFPDRAGELVPYVIVGGHRLELEPGAMIRPVELDLPTREAAE